MGIGRREAGQFKNIQQPQEQYWQLIIQARVCLSIGVVLSYLRLKAISVHKNHPENSRTIFSCLLGRLASPNPPGAYYTGPRGSSTLYSRYLGG